MSGNFWLNWATLSVSIFNTIIMLWMGLMILFSAEKRTWGVWLAAGGLLFGAMFFVSHTAIIGQKISIFTPGTNFWWHVGWGPVVVAPFVWYIVMLWFSGYWENDHSNIRVRHRPWLNISIAYCILLVALFIFVNPLSSLSPVTSLDYESGPAFSGIPLLFIAYPVFIFLCIVLSMDALIRPGPTSRFMGGKAREKARPWLAGAGFILLIVSFLVGFAILWILQNARQTNILPELYGNIAPTLAWMDFILSILIGTAVLLIGQAVVSYGLFTGKPLPRRVFRRQWLYAILMASIVAIIFAGSLKINLRMVYSLLLAVILLAVFFALVTWRYIFERDLAIQQVRPFLSSPKLVRSILSQDQNAGGGLDLQNTFAALVRDILDVDRAILVPAGGSSALVQNDLYYPAELSIPSIPPEIMNVLKEEYKGIGYPLSPEESDGFTWIIPLWSERGINGILYIGRKIDGSFISQEEIELARAASERLLDMALSAELSSRLLKLQQMRFSEQSIMDQRPRRVLHDEVLPALHTAMLKISSDGEDKQSTLQLLSETHRMISNLLKELPSVYSPQFERTGLTFSLQELAKVEFPNAFTSIEWKWTDEDANVVNELPVLKKEVLYYATREAIRNAATHAVPFRGETGIRLIVEIHAKEEVEITIEDNGPGMVQGKDKTAGTRQGLAIHSTLMALIGGELSVESEAGSYTRIRLVCPR